MRKKPVAFDTVSFGKRVKMVRNERDMTREEVAELCDISPAHLRNIECGNAIPSMPVFMMLSNVLKVSPNYLTQDCAEVLTDDEHDEIARMLLNATPRQASIIHAMLNAALEQLANTDHE